MRMPLIKPWCLAAFALAMTTAFVARAEDAKKEEPKPSTPAKTEEPKPAEPAKVEEPKKQDGELKQSPIDGLKEVVTESGLKYWDIKVGEGGTPTGPTTIVTIHYTGWLTDGTLFTSTLQPANQPQTRPLKEFITGWAEGVSTMKKGGKRRLEIPPILAYGDAGRPPKIPPKSTLIFEIELLNFREPPPPPKQTSIEGLNPTKLDSGVVYYDLKVGDGAMPSGPNAKISVQSTGWLKSDGTMFDSTVTKGQPYTMPLSGFIKGWTESVGTMKVGGKRRIEVPAALAYGERGFPPLIGPNADLVFEVELVKAD